MFIIFLIVLLVAVGLWTWLTLAWSYADGERASGPPERGLFTYDWKIASGKLHIDAGQMPTLSNSAKLVTISTAKGDCSCSG